MSRAFEKKRGNFLILPEVERQGEMTWELKPPLSYYPAGLRVPVPGSWTDRREGKEGRRSFSALIPLRRNVGNVKKNNNRETYTQGVSGKCSTAGR